MVKGNNLPRTFLVQSNSVMPGFPHSIFYSQRQRQPTVNLPVAYFLQ